MKKANYAEVDSKEKQTVDTNGLMEILGAGRKTAVEIGTQAGARIQIGRRVLWYLPKIEKYLDAISE